MEKEITREMERERERKGMRNHARVERYIA